MYGQSEWPAAGWKNGYRSWNDALNDAAMISGARDREEHRVDAHVRPDPAEAQPVVAHTLAEHEPDHERGGHHVEGDDHDGPERELVEVAVLPRRASRRAAASRARANRTRAGSTRAIRVGCRRRGSARSVSATAAVTNTMTILRSVAGVVSACASASARTSVTNVRHSRRGHDSRGGTRRGPPLREDPGSALAVGPVRVGAVGWSTRPPPSGTTRPPRSVPPSTCTVVPGDELRERRREEQRDAGDVVGLAEATERHPGGDRGARRRDRPTSSTAPATSRSRPARSR